jgi:hypothetical protein
MTPRIAGTQAKRACLVLLLCALAGEGASLRPRGPRRSPGWHPRCIKPAAERARALRPRGPRRSRGWHPRCIKHSEPATSPDR